MHISLWNSLVLYHYSFYKIYLTLKAPVTTPTDNILAYFLYFNEKLKLEISYEFAQEMPALFSHKIKNRMLSAILLDGALKGKSKALLFPLKCHSKV